MWDADIEALTGIPTHEAVGQTIWDVRFRSLPVQKKTAAYHNWLRQGFTQLLQTGHWQEAERVQRIELAHTNGHEFDVELVLSTLETAHGYRVVGTLIKPDPTFFPANAMQGAYQALIEHSLQGVVIFQGRRLVYVNDTAAAIMGYAPHELLSWPVTRLIKLVHPSLQKIAWQRLKEWRSGRTEPALYEVGYQHPDGSERWLQIHITRVVRQGKPALQAALLDITAHKAAQDALRLSLDQERRTREILLALGEAAQAVLRARTAPDIYRVVGEQVVALGYHVVVLRLQPDGKHVTVVYTTFSEEMIRRAEQITGIPMLDYTFVPPPGGYYDRILTGSQALYDDQSGKTISEAFEPGLRKQSITLGDVLEIRERIGAPLIIQGQVSGILLVNGTGLREEDVPAVAGFAHQTAIALENAALTAEDQRQKEALRTLSARLVRTQEAEQARIARELHDEAGQTLTTMNLHLTQAIEDLSQHSDETHSQTLERLINTRSLVEQTTRQIRELCFRLRPSILDEMGLVPALRWLCNWSSKQNAVQVRFRSQGEDGRLPSEIETTLYRIVQEGLTNITRYARAKKVAVCLEHLSSSIALTVQDNGVGFDVVTTLGEHARPSGDAMFGDPLGESTGLLGMRERVRLVGGQMNVRSQPGKGTRISIVIPLERG